jgi:multicomponent Na+:H+ antiporter subunit A
VVLPIVLTLLILTALSAPILDRYLGRSAGWPLAGVFLLLGGAVAIESPAIFNGEQVLEYTAAWMPAIDVFFRLRMDGTGLLFVILVLGVGALIMAYSARYFSRGKHADFYLLMSLFAAAMFGLVLADLDDAPANSTVRFDGCDRLGAANLRGTGHAALDHEVRTQR